MAGKVQLQWFRADRSKDQMLRASEDAGGYLCEYILYSSLAFLKHKGNAEIAWPNRTSVEFLHLPEGEDDASVEKGCEVAIKLILSLIDSRRQRDGDYDADGNRVE